MEKLIIKGFTAFNSGNNNNPPLVIKSVQKWAAEIADSLIQITNKKSPPRPDTNNLPPFAKQPSAKECISFCLAYAMACFDPQRKSKVRELATKCFENTPAMNNKWYRSIKWSIEQMKNTLTREVIYIDNYMISTNSDNMGMRSDQYEQRDKWVFNILFMLQGEHVIMTMPTADWQIIYYDPLSGDGTEVLSHENRTYKLHELENERGEVKEVYTIHVKNR